MALMQGDSVLSSLDPPGSSLCPLQASVSPVGQAAPEWFFQLCSLEGRSQRPVGGCRAAWTPLCPSTVPPFVSAVVGGLAPPTSL